MSDKYIATVSMDNYVYVMLGVHVVTRRVTELYLTQKGAFAPDPTKAAMFSGPMSAFMFVRSAPFTPNVPETNINGRTVPEYDLIPHSAHCKKVLIEYKYLPKDEKGEYHVDINWFHPTDNNVNALGDPCVRKFVNNQYPIDTGDKTHV